MLSTVYQITELLKGYKQVVSNAFNAQELTKISFILSKEFNLPESPILCIKELSDTISFVSRVEDLSGTYFPNDFHYLKELQDVFLLIEIYTIIHHRCMALEYIKPKENPE